MVFLFHDDLYKAFCGAGSKGASVCRKWEFAYSDVVCAVALLCFFLGDAHGGSLGDGIDDAGNHVEIADRIFAHCVFSGYFAHLEGGVGQHELAVDITCGIDIGYAGAHMIVYNYLTALCPDAVLERAKAFQLAHTADRQQHLVAGDGFAVTKVYGYLSIRQIFDALYLLADMNVDTRFFEGLEHGIGYFAIHSGGDSVQSFNYGDFAAKAVESHGHFAAYNAAAYYYKGLGQNVKLKHLGAEQYVFALYAGNGYDGGLGAAAEYCRGGFIGFAVAKYSGFGGHLGFAVYHGNVVGLEKAANSCGELLYHLVFVCHNLGHIHCSRSVVEDSALGCVADYFHFFGGFDVGFCRYASPVETGTAKGVLFKQDDFSAKLSRSNGSNIPGRAAAYDCYIVLHTSISSGF